MLGALRSVSDLRCILVIGLLAGTLTAQAIVPRATRLDAGAEPGSSAVDPAIGRATELAAESTVLVGRVLGPDGMPAEGAVVVTSAGGQAVTDAEGAFSLEVGVPVDAESVRVTAVMGSGTGSLVGRAAVGGLTAWGMTSAGTLVLEQAATCQPSWLPTFGGHAGVDDRINALTVFDDGSRPVLYAGGKFTSAGGLAANSIAKWNGTSWSALGSGVDGDVHALAVFDDGSGPALYAGGGSWGSGYVSKWDSSIWSELGSGFELFKSGSVDALTVFDDGSGPALYAAGVFWTAGGVSANNIAKWNGTSWSGLGRGVDGDVHALAVFDDGGGPALYAGGNFDTAGGVPAYNTAKWNGTSWSALDGVNSVVYALAAVDDGSGPALYAGCGEAGGGSVWKWDGSIWSTLGIGMNDHVYSVEVFDDGGGPALYAGGKFTSAGGLAANSIAKWDGTSWSALGSGMDDDVYSLAVFDDSSGPALYAGGSFSASPAGDSYLAKWGGCSPWTDLGSGLSGLSGIPQLTGSGELVVGTSGAIRLASAAPSALALLFVSTSSTPTPFKGGTLLPVPVLLTLPLATDSLGDILLSWAAWPSGLSGVSLFLQYAIQDAVAVQGAALSNALGADVP